jgi:hypothetical protein
MNANTDKKEGDRIQNTVLYGTNNVYKANLVQTHEIMESCLEVRARICGNVSVYVGHTVLLKRGGVILTIFVSGSRGAENGIGN